MVLTLSWFEEQLRDDAGFQNVPCSSGGQLALVGMDSCSLFPRPGHLPEQGRERQGAGAELQAGRRAPRQAKAVPKSIDGPMIGKISIPCRLRTRPARELRVRLSSRQRIFLKRVPAVHDTTIRLLNTASSSHYQAQGKANIRGITKREVRQHRGF